MQNMRLLDFYNNGDITLYPIQRALVNGFVSIRDIQDSIDKVIPLEKTLQYITANNKLRLTTNKKDIQLYEDFMLFFDRCKMQVRIEDRKTKEVLFEIMKPIPILSNTPAYNGKYGYVIGNSVINLLNNELGKIKTTPYQTTIKTNKKYLQSKSSALPNINIKETILPKIMQMINFYKKQQKYQSIININSLYGFQAMYNHHYRGATKEDKRKVRELIDKYLDSLIKEGLIVNYEPIIKKKEIEQYKIEINKDAKI